MKILKYTFYKDNLTVIDGEIVEADPTPYTLNFSLTMKGLELFEEEYGTPIINILLKEYAYEAESIEFLRALACSTYLKIDNNQVIQNEATVQEFKDMEEIYKSCASDAVFKVQLVSMAIECIEERAKKVKENNNPKKTGKSKN